MAVQKIEEIIQDTPEPFRGSKYGGASLAIPPPPTSGVMLAGNSMAQPLPPMTVPPPVVSGSIAPTNTTSARPGASSTCVEKIFIGLDHAPPSFDLRSRLIGSGGANLNYIRTETGAMATLRGRGSLFVDMATGMESPEPIHLYIEHLRFDGLQAAKQLARNLIETLQQELVQFQQMNPPMTSVVQQQPQVYTQHTMTQPPPLLAVPPPQAPPPQPQSLIPAHQLPQLQLHPGAQSLVQIAGQPTISLPPPALPIPIKTMLPAAAAPQLSQPPPSLHIQQHAPPAQTQIVVNQAVPIPIKAMVPQPNYQYQYIPAQDASTVAQQAAGPPGAVTIQHIYQTAHPSLPTQHVQSIIQPATSYSDVTTTTFAQQLIRTHAQQQPPPPPQPAQQFITVQGNTAYMVPPPSLMQGQPHPPPTSHSIIYSSHPPQQMLQQPPYYSVAQPMPAGIPVSSAEVKLEEKADDCGPPKMEGKRPGMLMMGRRIR